jgi:hypothetical protein
MLKALPWTYGVSMPAIVVRRNLRSGVVSAGVLANG